MATPNKTNGLKDHNHKEHENKHAAVKNGQHDAQKSAHQAHGSHVKNDASKGKENKTEKNHNDKW